MRAMNKTIFKSCISLMLGILFYYYSANGSDYLPPLLYWILVALQLSAYFEIMSILWTNTSSFCKSNYGWYYPLFLTILYLVPSLFVIIKHFLE